MNSRPFLLVYHTRAKWQLSACSSTGIPNTILHCIFKPRTSYSTLSPSKFVTFTADRFPASYNYYCQQHKTFSSGSSIGRFYELLTKDVFEYYNYGPFKFSSLVHTGKAGDGGIDLKGTLKYKDLEFAALVQCKCYRKRLSRADLTSCLGGEPMNKNSTISSGSAADSDDITNIQNQTRKPSVFLVVSTHGLGASAQAEFEACNLPVINVILRTPFTSQYVLSDTVDTNVLKFELNLAAVKALEVDRLDLASRHNVCHN